MITGLMELCLRVRWAVLLAVALVVGLGVWAFNHQQIDAYPDISSQMVQIITTFPGRAPEEVERQVTIPIERAMFNVPRVEVIRSRTIFGLSVVQMIFEEGTESYWARQRVQEKLGSIDLPDTAKPDLGPLATAYGEIFRYELMSDGTVDLTEVRTLNDWVVIPRLLRVAGIADVSNFGGYGKQYTVTLIPAQLQRYDISFGDVADAVKANNASAGGSVVRQGSMSFVIRGKGALESLRDIEGIFVKSVGGTAVYIRDLATVEFDHRIPAGIFGKDYTSEAVEGIVLMRKGENPSEVLERVNKAVEELNKSKELVEKGVRIVKFYDRTHLVQATMDTVSHSVLVGITLVVLILILFLGRPAMALLVALTIPFSLLFALILMYLVNIPIGLLSIGAIDFGIIVDGAVIMADNIAHRLGTLKERSPRKVWKTVLAAALEVERPLFVSVFMIIAAYLPLLTLTRIEGLLFRPTALTIVFALIGALIFALFVVPTLATLFFPRGYQEWENPLLTWFRPKYAHIIELFLYYRYAVAIATVVLFSAVTFYVVPRLGTEFLPTLDEGVMWVRANFPEGTSLQDTSRFGDRLRKLVLEFSDVKYVTTQTGRNDSGTDPFPPSRVEMMIIPYPREHWKQFQTKAQLVAAISARLRGEFPTTRFNFTQPIIDSVTEDANGTSANLAVELSGPDMAVLQKLAQQTAILMRKVPGAIDVNIEQEGPQTQLVIIPDRAKCARYKVKIDDLNKLINIAIGGDNISTIFEGERRFDSVVKFNRDYLKSVEALKRLPVYNADGVPIPLDQVTQRIDLIDGQTIIARENARRRLTVRCDIVGRDQGGFVAEAKALFEDEITPPEGYNVAWLGMFENLERAQDHFMKLIPLTILVIFAVLVVAFGSLRAAFILLLPIPFAFIGGAVALYLRGMNLNVSTGVGFATLFGVAIMDGVLMFKGITTFRLQGATVDEAIIQGRLSRLRPILMTSMVAILGLLPASLATGLGSDVQRPLATVIIWGLSSSMILTQFITPVFYRIFVPPLPTVATPVSEAEEYLQQLPDVTVTDMVLVMDHVHKEKGEADIYRIAEHMQRELGHIVAVVRALEMLGFVDTPQQMVVLLPLGERFVAAPAEERRELWHTQLLNLGLFREVYDVLQRHPEHSVDRDFVLETIVMRMPYENFERVFNTLVRWARFGDLFFYDETTQKLSLKKPETPPAGSE
jgi:cobalt-zinc-cadmium resistance protein CzcA